MVANNSTHTVSQVIRLNNAVASSTDIAGSLIPAPAGPANQRSATMLSTAIDIKRDLSRAVAAYVSVSDRHRTLFCRHLNLTAMPRDKVAGNIMTTMDSLECVGETLAAADEKLNAKGVCFESAVPILSEGELREVQHDIRDAEKIVQYVRARIDRIDRAMERLEAANDDRLVHL